MYFRTRLSERLYSRNRHLVFTTVLRIFCVSLVRCANDFVTRFLMRLGKHDIPSIAPSSNYRQGLTRDRFNLQEPQRTRSFVENNRPD